MLSIFLQHLIHYKMEAHVVILCLINAKFFVFQLKHYKKEVFEIIFLLLFHFKTHFIWLIIHFKNIQKCSIWMLLQIKITKKMTKTGHTEC